MERPRAFRKWRTPTARTRDLRKISRTGDAETAGRAEPQKEKPCGKPPLSLLFAKNFEILWEAARSLNSKKGNLAAIDEAVGSGAGLLLFKHAKR